jgi:hypothetical protein
MQHQLSGEREGNIRTDPRRSAPQGHYWNNIGLGLLAKVDFYHSPKVTVGSPGPVVKFKSALSG